MSIFSKKRNKGNTPLFLNEKGIGDNLDSTLRERFAEDNLDNDFFLEEGAEEKEIINIRFSRQKGRYLMLFALVLIFVLFFRAGYLQIVRGDYYRELAEGNRIRIHPIKSQRGIFYDRLGRQLVQNIPVFTLQLIPADLPGKLEDKKLLLKELLKTVDFSFKEALTKIENTPSFSYQPIVLKENIDHEKALYLKIKADDLPGVILETNYLRKYIIEDDNFLSSLSHVLGYTGKISEDELLDHKEDGYLLTDYSGKYGLEITQEKLLRGEYGKKQVEVDALGKENKIISEKKAISGSNLVLTIDIDLQKRVEEILTEVLMKNKKERASAVVMNPENGEILAMVSLPSLNSNDFAGGISSEKYRELLEDPGKPLFNRSIAGEYPSGSTFKPVVAAAALEEKIISENTSVNSVGGIRILSWFFPDWKAGGHGLTNIRKALAESVNTFFYYIGGGYKDFTGLGVNKITEYASLFGLSKKTGIELPGEAAGFLPSREWKEDVKNEAWYIGDTYHYSIGQGDILVTPLQVASYTSVFANKGKLFRPRLVKSILDQNKSIIKNVEPEIVNENFISPYNLEVVRKGLRDGVLYGSSRRLNSLPVTAAGKTGTAQWSSVKDFHSWYTCFAPYEKPQLVVTVLIEEGGEGVDIALPVAEEILRWWFSPK